MESKVENQRYFDTEYSSGDTKDMKSKQYYQEENNNKVDELSKELSEMGCIVNAVKHPPNICVESIVHEEANSGDEKEDFYDNEEDAYSDDFEDKSDVDDELKVDPEQNSVKSDSSRVHMDTTSSIKLSKSQSSLSSKQASVTGRSTGYGSLQVPQTRRINMSFTNERLREIERHNHILLNKILSARRKSTIPSREQTERLKRPMPSAAMNRKQQQRKIDHENMILLKKIQRAKSSSCSIRR